ncbi:MAG: hypothetical protein HY308_02095 [Gammaproteobacteria bacterium]|nr:hypothetical protein [Gammaproteobacteria bacterium]
MCECGYCFDPDALQGDAAVEYELQQLRLLRDYLAARVVQAEATMLVARQDAVFDRANTYKAAQALAAEQALHTARAQLDAHLVREAQLQPKVGATPAQPVVETVVIEAPVETVVETIMVEALTLEAAPIAPSPIKKAEFVETAKLIAAPEFETTSTLSPPPTIVEIAIIDAAPVVPVEKPKPIEPPTARATPLPIVVHTSKGATTAPAERSSKHTLAEAQKTLKAVQAKRAKQVAKVIPPAPLPKSIPTPPTIASPKPDASFNRAQAAKAEAVVRNKAAPSPATKPAKSTAKPVTTPKLPTVALAKPTTSEVKVAAPPESKPAAVARQECPNCTAMLPIDTKRCTCGYTAPSETSEMPSVSLDLAAKTPAIETAPQAKQECPNCTATVPIGANHCRCGYAFATSSEEVPAITLDATALAILALDNSGQITRRR